MSQRRLYRSRSSFIGGVCAGVADYFSVDPVIVRIVAVVLLLATAGAVGLGYLILWLIVPKVPVASHPLDVEPASVRSDTYGQVEWDAVGHREGAPVASCAEGRAACPGGLHQGVGHLPPEPPSGAALRSETDAAWAVGMAGEKGPSPLFPRSPLDRGAFPAVAGGGRPLGVKVALWVGLLLWFVLVLAVLSVVVEGIAWWRFWPLSCMIVGIASVVVPDEKGSRVAQFTDGMVLFFLGVSLLLMSVGIVSWHSAVVMLWHLWPLLIGGAVFAVFGRALGLPWWTLVGGLCFVAFCIVGLGWFSIPGQTDSFVLSTPLGWRHEFVIR